VPAAPSPALYESTKKATIPEPEVAVSPVKERLEAPSKKTDETMVELLAALVSERERILAPGATPVDQSPIVNDPPVNTTYVQKVTIDEQPVTRDQARRIVLQVLMRLERQTKT